MTSLHGEIASVCPFMQTALPYESAGFWQAVWVGKTEGEVELRLGTLALLPVQVTEVEQGGGVAGVKVESFQQQILNISFILTDCGEVV